MTALDQTRPLLKPKFRKAAEGAGDGYLDLLGKGENLPSTGVTQDLMTSGLVPRIYERWWRPALGRVAKGVTGPGMGEEIRIARLMLALSPGMKALDVACGPGNFSRAFARTVGGDGLVVGIDASQTMIERGEFELRRAGLANLALVRGDAVELPFKAGAFDAVCCFAALHLFSDPVRALQNMARVLKPGGRIALFTSARRQLTPPPVKPLFERLSGMRLFESGEVVAALEGLGFTGIHQRLSGMTQFVGGQLAA